MTTRHPTWHVVARATVRAGALASVAAAIAGWLLAGAPDVGTAIELEWHRWLALGATAARQLMGTAIAVTRERGRWLERSDGRKVLITLHPSALLRMEPADKAAGYAAWVADLKQAARHFASSDK